jgi:hypothetical protein
MDRAVTQSSHDLRIRKRVLRVLTTLAVIVTVTPAFAAASSPSMTSGTLVFAGARARAIGPANIAVPVRCLGGEAEFCAGAVTLMRNGHRHSVAFSLRGGSSQSLFVPLRHGDWGTRPRKVRALASTTEPLGAPSQVRTLFYAK